MSLADDTNSRSTALKARMQHSNHYTTDGLPLPVQSEKEKGQKDKQRSTNITHKTTDRVTRTPLKTGGELRCSGRIAVPAPLMAPVCKGHNF
jgi:hypothetical protein